MKINNILFEPILTEKATKLAKENKTYMFLVNKKSTKNQIKVSIEKIYSVKVESIKILIRKGRVKRSGRRLVPKKTSDKKIAFVKLSKGEIDIFPIN